MSKKKRPPEKSAPAATTAIEEWSEEGLVKEFRWVNDRMPDRQFCFILGSGASRSAGIPTGGELVERWLMEIRERHEDPSPDQTLAQWATAKNVGIKDFDYKRAATFYPQVYDQRFRDDPNRGFADLEIIMQDKEPTFGYSVLAQILENTRHKVVITTNFDNLVSDALAIYTKTFPLVCGHESLAAYARARLRRPLVAKIHRDLLLEPHNHEEEVKSLHTNWAEALKGLLAHYTPIVIGYGGNDGSLMGFLESLEPQDVAGNLYWCYRRAGSKPEEHVQKVIRAVSGKLVAIDGFDEFMLRLHQALEYESLQNLLTERAKTRAERYVAEMDRLRTSLGSPVPATTTTTTTPPPDEHKQAKHVPDSIAWWLYQLKVNAAKTPEEKQRLYEEAIAEMPNSAPLLGSYAFFLKNIRKEYDNAEDMYRRAIDADPNHARNLGNFAIFLTDIRKDHDKAEQMYRRAIDADPKHAINLGNFSRLLLTLGRLPEGLSMLDRAMAELPHRDADAIHAECWMYAYCCRPAEAQGEAIKQLKRLITQENIRTGEWDFGGVIAQAVKMGHSEAAWLPRLAAVLAGVAEPATLNEWPAWSGD